MPPQPVRLLGSILLALLVAGCSSAPPVPQVSTDNSPEWVRLRGFVRYCSNRLESAADRIAEQQADADIVRNTVY